MVRDIENVQRLAAHVAFRNSNIKRQAQRNATTRAIGKFIYSTISHMHSPFRKGLAERLYLYRLYGQCPFIVAEI